MIAVYAAAHAAVSRRRLQTVIVAMVVLLSAATSVLAVGLLVVSHAPFDTAFAAARGAHANVTVSSDIPPAALAATSTASGVTAADGPFEETTASLAGGGIQLGTATIVGRSARTGSVDRLSIDRGGWLTGPGQIVLSRDRAGPLAGSIGTDVTVNVPGAPALRLVGIADSITATADAWVWPGQTKVLHGTGAPTAEQMLYRFSSHETVAALHRAIATATTSLAAGAVTGVSTYLSARQEANRSISAFVPFVVAFAVLGILLSLLITTNVVNGAVVSGYRTIGILKTLGYTPRQVVAVYVAQVLVPGIVGCAAGVALGVALAAPLLAQTDRAYNVPAAVGGVPAWIIAAVLVGAPLLVAIAAIGPALRAGRLPANKAISVGRAPRAGRGYRLRRMIAATPMPRSVAFGLGMPLARPARAAGTVIAIMLGAVTLVFAVGLSTSVGRVHDGFSRVAAVPIVAHIAAAGRPAGKPGGLPDKRPDQPAGTPVDAAAVRAAIAAQPGTAHAVQVEDLTTRIAGFTQDITVEAYAGDATWAGFPMISGHWYTGTDQVVASSYLLRQTGHHVGDQLTLLGDRGQRAVSVAGEFLDGSDGFTILADTSAAAGLSSRQPSSDVEIGLTSGTDPSAYARALQGRFPFGSQVFIDNRTQDNSERTFAILDALITTLTLLLCGVAALGVLNTVVLNTRERIHDIGVLKSLGMTPGQVRTMVVTSMIGLGALAGALAVPSGVALHHRILPAMADAAGTALPRSIIDVYGPRQLLFLGAVGIALAVLGALLPAGWAAHTRVANALHAE